MINLLLLNRPIILGVSLLIAAFAFNPSSQIYGTQTDIFTSETITTTAKTETIACGHRVGSIGRKTVVIENDANSNGTVTVTVELRDRAAGTNFTSGYVAHYSLATNTLTYTTKTPTTDIPARFCQVSAYSANTSTITMSLRKE